MEHLQELVNNLKKDEKPVTKPVPNETSTLTLPIKISSSTNTTLNPIDDNLIYMRGLYNGSIELISYLIEYTQSGNENQTQMADSVELLLELFRQYHRIYFNTHRLNNDKELEYITSCLKTRRFPLNNKKLIQKIKISLDNNNVQLPANFYQSICNLFHRNHSHSSSSSSSNSSIENYDDISGDCIRRLDNGLSNVYHSHIVPKKTNFDNQMQIKKNFQHSKEFTETDELKKAKKLKSNLIQRFNHASHERDLADHYGTRKDDIIEINSSDSNYNLEDNQLVYPDLSFKLNVDRNYLCSNHNYFQQDTHIGKSSEMLSVFILHNSQDFYISACIDESLIESGLIKNIFKNKNFKPNVLQKVKLDVLFSSDIIIRNRNSLRNK